ncbi:hypothetical protein MBBTH_19360 [Methanobrevibacter thaueri]|uniref:Uncharacterized protein n=1 Tax=Methanobrevibacter thaueri TaxID=190975 RepID=A0A315XNA4_9EURY|nr:hypothetical protein MBBTH_19360 [Methanobrevibacter thaueri]
MCSNYTSKLQKHMKINKNIEIPHNLQFFCFAKIEIFFKNSSKTDWISDFRAIELC